MNARVKARMARLKGTRAKRTRLYSDAVADKGRVAAAKAMQAGLHRVLAAVKAAHSFDDLKKRLAHEFKSMRPEELARVVAKARVMAHVGGMDSAWQQV